MPASVKKIVYGLVILCGLGALVWQLLGPEANPYPDTPESATGWICSECGELRMLTARERDAWTMSQDKVLRGQKATGGSVTMGSERTIFKCERCGEFALLRARQCRIHQEWHLVRDIDGQYVGCEKCAGT